MKKNKLNQIANLTNDVKKILSYTPLQYMVDAVDENPSLANIYVDDDNYPSACIMMLGHYIFLGGNISRDLFKEFNEAILTEERRKSLGILIVFYENDKIADLWRNLYKVHDNERSVYYIKPSMEENIILPDYIFPITDSLLESDIQNLNMILDEVLDTGTYKDMKDFCIRGIGFTPIYDKKVYGFCTSEYPSRNAVAIGIEVHENYKRRGIAKIMTKAFLNEASKRNLDVYWECWKKNEASYKTAISCGFKKITDYPVLFVELI